MLCYVLVLNVNLVARVFREVARDEMARANTLNLCPRLFDDFAAKAATTRYLTLTRSMFSNGSILVLFVYIKKLNVHRFDHDDYYYYYYYYLHDVFPIPIVILFSFVARIRPYVAHLIASPRLSAKKQQSAM